MPDTIRDGKGKGYLAAVDRENHLHTAATTETRIAHRSSYDATAFGTGTPFLTITTTGGHVLYIKNISQTHKAIFTDLWISWNGGSTNRDRIVKAHVDFGASAPSGNNTVGAAGNLNQGSTKGFDLAVEYWDGVGDGMTIAGGELTAFNWMNPKGLTYVPIQGAIILGANNSVTFNLKAEEIGEASISVLGYMEGI